MEDPVADAILNQYFRRLEQALSGLAAERRAQIVEDLRTHVEECLQAESDHSDRSRAFCSAATAPRRHLSNTKRPWQLPILVRRLCRGRARLR